MDKSVLTATPDISARPLQRLLYETKRNLKRLLRSVSYPRFSPLPSSPPLHFPHCAGKRARARISSPFIPSRRDFVIFALRQDDIESRPSPIFWHSGVFEYRVQPSRFTVFFLFFSQHICTYIYCIPCVGNEKELNCYPGWIDR